MLTGPCIRAAGKTKKKARIAGAYAPSPATLPAGWTQHYSPVKNKWYFYHKATGISTYDKPDGKKPDDGAPTDAGSSASSSGCDWTGPLSKRAAHVESDCPFKPVLCQ